MAYRGDDEYDYYGRRPSPGRRFEARRSQAFLDPGAGLYRTRSQGHAPTPIVNIYNDQIQDAALRADSPYPSPPLAPYPPSPEMRGRRLGDELVEDLADMALRDRLRSRSRRRTDAAVVDRSDLYALRLAEKEAELQRLKGDKEAKEERERIIMEYEENRRKEEEREKAEKVRIREELEREKREAKEREEREWTEFLRKQREKEEKEKREKKEAEEKFATEMRRRLAKFGYTDEQIEIMIDEEKMKKYKEGRSPRRGANGELTVWKSGRAPVYAKIHRDYLSVETLRYYDIPYEYDRRDPNFIIILREMDKYETEVLFEHTRRLRSGKLLIEAPKDRPKYAWYRKRDRSTSRVRREGILIVKD